MDDGRSPNGETWKVDANTRGLQRGAGLVVGPARVPAVDHHLALAEQVA